MIVKWFKQDIDDLLKEHTRVVITDKGGNGRFLVDELHTGYNVLKADNELEELYARYKAEKEYSDKPVIFYATMGKGKLRYLLEYAETGGLIQLDSIEQYVRDKLWQHLKINAAIDGAKLVTAAKLGKGNDDNWWKMIAQGLEEPFSVHENLIDFLQNPSAYKGKDADLYKMLVENVCELTGISDTGQSADTLASELMKSIFDRLLDNTLEGKLLKLYNALTSLSHTRNVVKNALSEYKLPKDADFRKASPDHCFEKIDEAMMHSLAKDIVDGKSLDDYITYLKARISGKEAIDYKPSWLLDVYVVLTFKADGIKKLSSLDDTAAYYRDTFCHLDAAMRHIYVAWLKENSVLRPIQQSIYEQYEKELLDKWFSFTDGYEPTQFDFIAQKLNQPGRSAVIVGDGLRLSLVETAIQNIRNKNVHISKDTMYAVLPSVTENGMSVLYGCETKTKVAEERRQHLRNNVEGVEIMDFDEFNSSVTAQKLVLCFSDIDEMGEKKQLGALKDIDKYEQSLAERIEELIDMGYRHVWVTTDHGFVLTGILDDADKQPVPSQPVKKVEERFILADEPVNDDRLIERQDDFFCTKYQYYAKTDRPFFTKGKYGYSHGGFTPQECVIPAYEFSVDVDDSQLEIVITNKRDLAEVTGDMFVVKLKADGDASNLFGSSRKIKVVVFANGKQTQKSQTINITAQKEIEPLEFDIDNNDKVVVIDADTREQLDSALIKKSDARDLGGLL